MARLVVEIACGLAESFLETLPSSEGEAGVWLGGLLMGFALNWALLLVTTFSHCASTGGCW
jgi:hypothetical protein